MAKGSHATWGSSDSRSCAICEKPIRLTTQNAWIHHDDVTGEAISTHPECGSPLQVTKIRDLKSTDVDQEAIV